MKTADLEKLTQAEAAWLLGIVPRSLRDKADVPRNDDGTYNAKSLLDWSRGRTLQAADLPDSDLEKLLLITGLVRIGSLEGPNLEQQTAAVRALDAARKRHGDGVLLEFADRILSAWRQEAADLERLEQRPGYAARQAAEAAAAKAREDAEADLRIVVQCHLCKRIRRGRKWVAAKVPVDHVARADKCPTCPHEA